MKKQMLVISTAIIVVLFCVGGIAAQGAKKMGGDAKMMAEMKKSPHHKLMMAYMTTMSHFSKMLCDQALTPMGPDAEFARATVAELRHDLDSMEALKKKHMDAMSPEMMAKMKTMMEKMDKGQAMVREHVAALEAAVKTDKPDAKVVAMHSNDLVKHFAMMMKPGPKAKKTAM